MGVVLVGLIERRVLWNKYRKGSGGSFEKRRNPFLPLTLFKQISWSHEAIRQHAIPVRWGIEQWINRCTIFHRF